MSTAISSRFATTLALKDVQARNPKFFDDAAAYVILDLETAYYPNPSAFPREPEEKTDDQEEERESLINEWLNDGDLQEKFKESLPGCQRQHQGALLTDLFHSIWHIWIQNPNLLKEITDVLVTLPDNRSKARKPRSRTDCSRVATSDTRAGDPENLRSTYRSSNLTSTSTEASQRTSFSEI